MSEKIACSKCGGELAILKVVQKGINIVAVGRCPSCKAKAKFVLNYNDKDSWLEDLANGFFVCDLCGAKNMDNFTEQSYLHPGAFTSSQRIKVFFLCKGCNKQRKKDISQEFWSKIKPFTEEEVVKEKPEQKSPGKELKCPKCGGIVSTNDKFCKSCGFRLFCDNCKTLLAPGSSFCTNCGEEV